MEPQRIRDIKASLNDMSMEELQDMSDDLNDLISVLITRQVAVEDFQEFHYILAMDHENYEILDEPHFHMDINIRQIKNSLSRFTNNASF